MLTARETEAVLSKFFNECLRYWTMQGHEERSAFENALDDVKNVKRDPYSPVGKHIDLSAKEKFIHYREMDLGRR